MAARSETFHSINLLRVNITRQPIQGLRRHVVYVKHASGATERQRGQGLARVQLMILETLSRSIMTAWV